ncbi:MAG TPA: TerC family protein [Nitrospirota bacterium]
MAFSETAIIAQITGELHSIGLVDALTVATLAALEGILSVDNALVLAILVRTLPKSQQKKALTYGIAGAFLFRFIAIIFAAYLMRLMVFKLIGGGYLLYLAMKHMFFFREDAYKPAPKGQANFWKTVAVVELTDIAFSIDSITTAVAMTDKIIIVWMGGILGIIFLRFAASFFVRLLEKLPRLEDLAYQLIFFIGTKLFLEAFHVEFEHWVFWTIMGIITLLGSSLVYKDYHQRITHTRHVDLMVERLKAGELTVDELADMDTIPGPVIAYLKESGKLG